LNRRTEIANGRGHAARTMTDTAQPGMELSGKRVLLVGGAGFIGRWVARRLNATGCELWLAGRSRETMLSVARDYGIRCQVLVADFSVAGSFATSYWQVQPALTFNFAGYGIRPDEQDETLARNINANLPAEITETIGAAPGKKRNGVQLFHAGSGAEYGPVCGPVTETAEEHPASLYAATKREGTRRLLDIAAQRGVRAICARFFTVYGVGEHAGRLFPSLFRAARLREKVALSAGTQTRDFTYVEDVAEGALRLACANVDSPAVVNVATGAMRPVREVILEAAAALGLRAEQMQFGAEPARTHDFAQGAVDTTKLRRLTGWTPQTTVSDGIKRMQEFATQSGVTIA